MARPISKRAIPHRRNVGATASLLMYAEGPVRASKMNPTQMGFAGFVGVESIGVAPPVYFVAFSSHCCCVLTPLLRFDGCSGELDAVVGETTATSNVQCGFFTSAMMSRDSHFGKFFLCRTVPALAIDKGHLQICLNFVLKFFYLHEFWIILLQNTI